MIGPTLLYGLPLKGEGTPAVEGLLSYSERLAYAHNVPVYALWDLVCLAYPKGEISTSSTGGFHTRQVNGISAPGRDLLERLQLATRQDLRSSTLTRFAPVLSCMHLSHRTSGRYCPVCVRVHEQPEEISSHLAWDVQCVECCPKHGVLLEKPGACGASRDQQFAPWRRLLLPCVCPRCGSIGHLCHGTGVVSAPESKIWVAESVGRLLSMTSERVNALSSASLKEGLSALVEMRYAGSPVRAALDCGCGRATVRSWLLGITKPAFSLLVGLCYRAEADIASLLEGRYVHVPSPAESLDKVKRRTYARAPVKLTDVAQALELATKREAPPTARDLAREIGVTSTYFRDFLPMQAAQLALARQKYIERVNLEKRHSLHADLVSKAEKIVALGKTVTRSRLIEEGGKPMFSNSWRRPVLEAVLSLYSSPKSRALDSAPADFSVREV